MTEKIQFIHIFQDKKNLSNLQSLYCLSEIWNLFYVTFLEYAKIYLVELFMDWWYTVSYSVRICTGLIHDMGKTSWMELPWFMFGWIGSYSTTLQWAIQIILFYTFWKKKKKMFGAQFDLVLHSRWFYIIQCRYILLDFVTFFGDGSIIWRTYPDMSVVGILAVLTC